MQEECLLGLEVASTMTEARAVLERFFHDLATPLSGLSLHLDRAVRMAARGEDPSEALGVAQRELERPSSSSSRDGTPSCCGAEALQGDFRVGSSPRTWTW